MTRLNTCAVEGRRDASTTLALSADVKLSDDARLFVSSRAPTQTHVFCSSMTATMPPTPLFARFRRRRRRLRASGPVEKSDSRRCTKNSMPARGQIVSDVVAEVSVPSTGERRESNSGGSSSGRIAESAGRRAEERQWVSKLDVTYVQRDAHPFLSSPSRSATARMLPGRSWRRTTRRQSATVSPLACRNTLRGITRSPPCAAIPGEPRR